MKLRISQIICMLGIILSAACASAPRGSMQPQIDFTPVLYHDWAGLDAIHLDTIPEYRKLIVEGDQHEVVLDSLLKIGERLKAEKKYKELHQLLVQKIRPEWEITRRLLVMRMRYAEVAHDSTCAYWGELLPKACQSIVHVSSSRRR